MCWLSHPLSVAYRTEYTDNGASAAKSKDGQATIKSPQSQRFCPRCQLRDWILMENVTPDGGHGIGASQLTSDAAPTPSVKRATSPSQSMKPSKWGALVVESTHALEPPTAKHDRTPSLTDQRRRSVQSLREMTVRMSDTTDPRHAASLRQEALRSLVTLDDSVPVSALEMPSLHDMSRFHFGNPDLDSEALFRPASAPTSHVAGSTSLQSHPQW